MITTSWSTTLTKIIIYFLKCAFSVTGVQERRSISILSLMCLVNKRLCSQQLRHEALISFLFKNLLALNNYIYAINIFRCFGARIGPEPLTPPFWLKRFPQCWQMWGFSPVWSFMWFLREPGFASSLGQTVHCTCQRSTEWKRSVSTILKYQSANISTRREKVLFSKIWECKTLLWDGEKQKSGRKPKQAGDWRLLEESWVQFQKLTRSSD